LREGRRFETAGLSLLGPGRELYVGSLGEADGEGGAGKKERGEREHCRRAISSRARKKGDEGEGGREASVGIR
jgi:hypothetical protein